MALAFDRLRPRLVRALRGRLGDRAEDAAQEAILRLLLRGEPMPTDGGEALALAICVALRATRDEARSDGARRRRECTWGESRGSAQVSDDVAAQLERCRVLRRLPPDERTVLVLCDGIGLTDSEAADRLRVPAGTIKSRLRRARSALRQWASQSNEGEIGRTDRRR